MSMSSSKEHVCIENSGYSDRGVIDGATGKVCFIDTFIKLKYLIPMVNLVKFSFFIRKFVPQCANIVR